MKLDDKTNPLVASAPVRSEQPVVGLFCGIEALLFGDMDSAANVDVGVGVGLSVGLLLPHAADSTPSPINVTRAVRLLTAALRSENVALRICLVNGSVPSRNCSGGCSLTVDGPGHRILNGISRLDHRWHGAGRRCGGACAGCGAVLR